MFLFNDASVFKTNTCKMNNKQHTLLPEWKIYFALVCCCNGHLNSTNTPAVITADRLVREATIVWCSMK